MTKTTH